MAHSVICSFCNKKFDRDKIEYCKTGARRYAHAACMLRKASEDISFVKLEIINPLDNVVCVYCQESLNRKDADCVMVSEGKYAHKNCAEIEANREKTDLELLEDYIKVLFKCDYVPPRIRQQINEFVAKYNYTYSGIRKSLQYFYEVKGNPISKANGGIGIVPYVHKDAYNYYYSIWLAHQKTENIEIKQYVPKVKEITIPRPQIKVKKRNLFSFLDEEVDNGK